MTRRRLNTGTTVALVAALVLAGCSAGGPVQEGGQEASADPVATAISSPGAGPATDVTPPGPLLVSTPPPGWGQSIMDSIAVSADEVWVSRQSGPSNNYEWLRFHRGTWQLVGVDCVPVGASDGAVWVTTVEGLTRFFGDESRVVAASVRICPVLAGPDGSVWMTSSSGASLELYLEDGTQTEVETPGGYEEFCPLTAGRDGSLWLAAPGRGENGPWCGSYRGLARWDGHRWTLIDTPDGYDEYCLVGAGQDGTPWLAPSTHEGSGPGCHTYTDLARWDGRRWTQIDLSLEGALRQDSTVDWRFWGELSWPAITDDGAVWAWDGLEEGLGRNTTGPWTVVADDLGDAGGGALTPAPGGTVCAEIQEEDDGAEAVVCYAADGEVARYDTSSLSFSVVQVAQDGSVWALGDQIARLPGRLPARGSGPSGT